MPAGYFDPVDSIIENSIYNNELYGKKRALWSDACRDAARYTDYLFWPEASLQWFQYRSRDFVEGMQAVKTIGPNQPQRAIFTKKGKSTERSIRPTEGQHLYEFS